VGFLSGSKPRGLTVALLYRVLVTDAARGTHEAISHHKERDESWARHCGDFVGPANVACCQQRTYSVTFRTSRYAKYFVFKSFRSQRPPIRNRQVIGSSPIVGSSNFFCFIDSRHRWWALFLQFFGLCNARALPHTQQINIVGLIPSIVQVQPCPS